MECDFNEQNVGEKTYVTTKTSVIRIKGNLLTIVSCFVGEFRMGSRFHPPSSEVLEAAFSHLLFWGRWGRIARFSSVNSVRPALKDSIQRWTVYDVMAFSLWVVNKRLAISVNRGSLFCLPKKKRFFACLFPKFVRWASLEWKPVMMKAKVWNDRDRSSAQKKLYCRLWSTGDEFLKQGSEECSQTDSTPL